MEGPHRGRSCPHGWLDAHRVRRLRPCGRRPGDHLRGSRPGRGHELRGQPDRRRLPECVGEAWAASEGSVSCGEGLGYGRTVGGVKQVQMSVWYMVTVWVYMFWHVVIA